jgi:4-hydroxybenzoate polyprenyltransferase
MSEPTIPLVVDCERALLRTNVLDEAVFLLAKQSFLDFIRLPAWALQGKPVAIAKIAERIRIDWSTIPIDRETGERLRKAHDDGRQVFLATSLPLGWAQEICTEFGWTGSIAIESSRVPERFANQKFEHIGECTPASSEDRGGPLLFLKMIRVHQWLKNLLILVPLLASHRLTSFRDLGFAATAFLAFSCCASSVYLLNDLLDLESDRQHARKRHRPIASGRISARRAALVGMLLLATSVGLAFQVSALFALALAIYFALTLTYSLRLKRQVVVDVMLLAALYTIRVLAGAVATAVVPSFWLLAFSMFLFLSLAVVKRYSEMLVTLSQEKQQAAGRGYTVQDLPVLLSLGVSTGVAAIVVLALYINDPATSKLYPSTLWLWLVPPLMLYWISRVWMKAHRGEMHDDPVVFAMRDWQSLITAVLGGICFGAASLA